MTVPQETVGLRSTGNLQSAPPACPQRYANTLSHKTRCSVLEGAGLQELPVAEPQARQISRSTRCQLPPRTSLICSSVYFLRISAAVSSWKRFGPSRPATISCVP